VDTVKKSAVFEKEKVVDVAQKSTSIESEDNPSMRVPWMNNAIHHYHKGTLDHVLVAPNIISLWNANLTNPKFVQSFPFMTQTNRGMMDYVGPEVSLDVTSLAVFHHRKETVSKADEKTKAMVA